MKYPQVERPYATHVTDYALAGWPVLVLPSKHKVLLDPADYAVAAAYDWRASPDLYVRANVDGDRVFLHRWLTGAGPGQVVDHINHFTLDNRRANLRVCTGAENLCNKKLPANNTSGYKGVVWRPNRKKWEASIQPRGRALFLGRFNDPWDAAQAYNAAALELFGAFAHLNTRIEDSK